MSSTVSSSQHPKSRFIRLYIFLGLTAGLILLVCTGVLCVGRWLVIEDPLEKAQAIVVLSGDIPMRAMEAAKIYHAGYAQQIWITHLAFPAEPLAELGIPYVAEDFYNIRVLVHEGVPADAARVLQPPIVNTADEIRAIVAKMAEDKDDVVIIVTSKAHTRRVHALWRKIAGRRGRVIVRAATDDSFDPAHWWRTSRSALDVLREVLGLLNTWADLPLPGTN